MGVFDALLETLSEMVERDGSADMIDSAIVRAHHCAVGLKKHGPDHLAAFMVALRIPVRPFPCAPLGIA
jgi:hypothetical protein